MSEVAMHTEAEHSSMSVSDNVVIEINGMNTAGKNNNMFHMIKDAQTRLQ